MSMERVAGDERGLGRLMPLIHCLVSRVRCRVSRICQEAGYPLTPEETDMLLLIRHCNGLPQSHLARMLGKDRASVTRLMNRLVEHGLVMRDRDVRDRRIIRARITEKGKQAFISIWPALEALSGTALAGLSEAEISKACTLMARINANLAMADDEDCWHAGG